MELEKKVSQESPVSEDALSETQQPLLSPLQKYLEEKKFSKEEYSNIIEGAELLRQIDAQKGKRVEDLLERFPTEEKFVPLSRIYALAQDLDIAPKYVEKYMSLRFPSAEQQWSDISKLKATPGRETRARMYGGAICDALMKAFPNDEFDFRYSHTDGWYHLSRIDKKIKQTWLLKRKKIYKKKKELAKLYYLEVVLNNVEVNDPSFLCVCGNTLTKLMEFLGDKPHIIYHYPIDLAGKK